LTLTSTEVVDLTHIVDLDVNPNAASAGQRLSRFVNVHGTYGHVDAHGGVKVMVDAKVNLVSRRVAIAAGLARDIVSPVGAC